jgi:hypothetical protein
MSSVSRTERALPFDAARYKNLKNIFFLFLFYFFL